MRILLLWLAVLAFLAVSATPPASLCHQRGRSSNWSCR